MYAVVGHILLGSSFPSWIGFLLYGGTGDSSPFLFLSCSKENVSELSRQKLDFRPFLSWKALAETKAESRLAGLREQLAKLVTFLN